MSRSTKARPTGAVAYTASTRARISSPAACAARSPSMSCATPTSAAGLPSASSTRRPAPCSQCAEPSGHSARMSIEYGTPSSSARRTAAASPSRSSGWTRARKSSKLPGASPGAMPYRADSEDDQRSSPVRRSTLKVPARAASSASSSSSGLRPPSGSVPNGEVMSIESCVLLDRRVYRSPGRGPRLVAGRAQSEGMDPFDALDLPSGASAQEAAEAYRRLAKRWHPDRGGGATAAARMAEINAAYDLLRARDWQREPPAPQDAVSRVAAGRAPAGAWLAEALRRALGRELLIALDDAEDVALVTPAATWASPRTLLAVTDRRLLWLLDDAPTHRVRSLRYGAIAEVTHWLRRPLRRVAVLRVRTTSGRALSFTELRPATAAAIAGHVAGARMAALGAAS